jgi:hypothetical protein
MRMVRDSFGSFGSPVYTRFLSDFSLFPRSERSPLPAAKTAKTCLRALPASAPGAVAEEAMRHRMPAARPSCRNVVAHRARLLPAFSGVSRRAPGAAQARVK